MEKLVNDVIVLSNTHSSTSWGSYTPELFGEIYLELLSGPDPLGPKEYIKNFRITGRRGLQRMFNYQFGDE